MSRLTTAAAVLSLALGSALALPAAAQAAVSAPTAGHYKVVPNLTGGNYQWVFSGATFPLTSAGLSSCNAEGAYDIRTYPKTDQSWLCRGNTPDSGVYNLWIYFNPQG